MSYFQSLVAPLRVPIFRHLWMATLASNIGTLMHSVGAAWLMTSMTTSPLLVGLVPASIFLPTFFAGIWGGVLSDIVERRRLLIVTQSGMMACAVAMGTCTLLGIMTPALLLGITFSLGFFSAMNLPAWQSQIQEMVPAEAVAAAVSLNSISFNTARTIGPAVGGVVVAATGPATVFFLNAASFLGTILVLAGWKRPPRKKVEQAVWAGLKEGFWFVIRSPQMRAPMLRVSAFAFAGSAVWAMLPLLAREQLGAGAVGYGSLLTAFGLGSVAISGLLPGLRGRHHPDRIIAPATALLAAVFLTLGISRHYPVVLAALFLGGMSWVAVLVQLNVAVQLAAPEAVRGRAMSFYLMFFQGSLGLGSAFNGWLADGIGIPKALLVAGFLLLAGIPLIFGFPLLAGHELRGAARPREEKGGTGLQP